MLENEDLLTMFIAIEAAKNITQKTGSGHINDYNYFHSVDYYSYFLFVLSGLEMLSISNNSLFAITPELRLIKQGYNLTRTIGSFNYGRMDFWWQTDGLDIEIFDHKPSWWEKEVMSWKK